ncbi:hypothetical protein [Desulfogranum mediterraneum]|uniref:hypothetical protein n=1 Tax=Desulfogranum mediterraneum TaxID=160661 RepID=UPI0003F74A9A|nr:hypothetical protein [Desulfogranum mediterraneum]
MLRQQGGRGKPGQGLFGLILLATLLLSGCALSTPSPDEYAARSAPTRVIPADFSSRSLSLQPVFTLHGSEEVHNRIGTVEASREQGMVEVRVNPERPTLYTAEKGFTTTRGAYRNQIYRLHFSRTPFSLIPFHLTAGRHPGLLVIITSNPAGRPLLVTTVHTCGCYVAQTPTAWLDPASYPDNWPQEYLPVYGERLPARLEQARADQALEIVIRPEIHRVMALRLVSREKLIALQPIRAALQPLAALRALPLGDGEFTSFYYRNWPLGGHVRGAVRWWEMLLLSLPSLDLLVGMDKDFGDTAPSSNPFYTSLKPWNRSASDLNDFPGFLRFMGWKL